MAHRIVKLPSGNIMPTLGLGTVHLVGDEGVQAMEAALDLGYRHLDTAEVYGNHEEVGRAIRGYDRADIFITSKVPPARLHFDEVIDACRAALLELDTDYIDLYLIHWPNPDVPIPQTLDALAELLELGLVRDVGVSNFNRKRLAQALEIGSAPIANNQVELHPGLYQAELLAMCHERGVTVTAYAPIARGKVLDHPVIADLARRYERTPPQICLRWLLQKGCIVIPRSTSEEHLRENLDIYGWEIAAEDEAAIDGMGGDLRLVSPDFPDFQEE